MVDPNYWEIKGMETKLSSSKSKVRMIQDHVSQLQTIKQRIEKDFASQAYDIMSVINESRILNRKIKDFHDYNLGRIAAAEADFGNGLNKSKELLSRFKECYEILTKINDFLTKIELDVSLMRIELKELITRGELLKIHGDPLVIGKAVSDVLARFEKVVQQKNTFEEEVQKVNMLQNLLIQKV